MSKSPAPKRLWVRLRQDQKVSIAEYVNNTRCNICEPFRMSNVDAVHRLRETIWRYKTNTKREVVLTGDVLLGLAEELGVKYES